MTPRLHPKSPVAKGACCFCGHWVIDILTIDEHVADNLFFEPSDHQADGRSPTARTK
jgi:hypothetical protein